MNWRDPLDSYIWLILIRDTNSLSCHMIEIKITISSWIASSLSRTCFIFLAVSLPARYDCCLYLAILDCRCLPDMAVVYPWQYLTVVVCLIWLFPSIGNMTACWIWLLPRLGRKTEAACEVMREKVFKYKDQSFFQSYYWPIQHYIIYYTHLSHYRLHIYPTITTTTISTLSTSYFNGFPTFSVTRQEDYTRPEGRILTHSWDIWSLPTL